MASENKIIDEFNKLNSQLSKLDFPLFSSKTKRENIIIETRNEVDNKIIEIVKLYCPQIKISEEQLQKLWEKTKKSVKREFDHLPDKLKINAFYFQELMCKYVEIVFEEIIKDNV